MDTAMNQAAAGPVPVNSTLFCSGFGSADTHEGKVLRNGNLIDNPSPNRLKPYTGISLREIVEMARNPPSVDKAKARWVIPSAFLGFNGRGHDAQRDHGKFWMLALDLDKGNPTLAEIDAALDAVCGEQVGRIIYSTKSSTAALRKWRAFIPLREPIAGQDYRATSEAFYALLTEAQPTVIPDPPLARTGQLVYLPNRGEFYEHKVFYGQCAVLTAEHPVIVAREARRAAALKAHDEIKAAQAARAARRAQEAGNEGGDIPGAFGARREIADLLIEYGYEQDGFTSNDWRSIYQGSGSYATHDFGTHWVSLSASDAAKGLGVQHLNGYRWGDAFDLFVHYEHEGDFDAAIKAAAKQLGLDHVTQREKRLEGLLCVVEEEPDTSAFDAATKAAEAEGAKPRPGLFFDASTLAGTKAPDRVWIVPSLIPSDTVTLFSGDGGTGKSLLSLQLAVAVASGTSWIGMDVKQGTAVFLSAEDDRDELHRRLTDIARAEGLDMADMSNLKISSLAGEDALLAVLKGGALEATRLLGEIDAYLATVGPTLVVLDTSADLYGGNEIDRAQVRQFVGMLRKLAIKYRCAVMLLSHPSVAGMSTGSGLSGSTAWNNSVRSRIYLERVAQPGGKDDDPDARRLSSKKSNYGPMGVEYALRWQGGVFVSAGAIADVKAEMEDKARRVFLDLLRQFNANGIPVNPSSSASYAPKVFADHPGADGLSKAAFKVAMANLLKSEEIKVIVTGPPSRPVRHLVIAEPSSPFGEGA